MGPKEWSCGPPARRPAATALHVGPGQRVQGAEGPSSSITSRPAKVAAGRHAVSCRRRAWPASASRSRPGRSARTRPAFLTCLPAGTPFSFQPERRVVEHRAPGHEAVALGHVPDRAEQFVGLPAVEQHPVAARRPDSLNDDVEEGRLATSRGTHDRDEFAGSYFDADILQRGDVLAATSAPIGLR